jgi:biotin transport system substrate-specific component
VATSESALGRSGRIVLADVLPGERVRDVALVIAFACVTGLSAQWEVKLPFTPVPVTGQTLAVLLGGVALGSGRALSGMVLYLVAGLTPWVPWFAGGRGGTNVLMAPSFGYIVGFIFAAGLVGKLAERGWDRTPLRTIATMVAGNLVIYAFGVPWLMAVTSSDLATGLSQGVVPFLPLDAIKIVVAAGLVPAAWVLTGRRND